MAQANFSCLFGAIHLEMSREIVPHAARAVIGLPSLPRRCRWLGSVKKVVRLDAESAPVARAVGLGGCHGG